MASPSPAPHPPLTRSKRFLWMLTLVGGFSFAIKFLGIFAREEKLFEDMVGDRSKLSVPTQVVIQWQHWLGANFLYLILAGIIVLIWIGFAKSARRVQIVVLTLIGFLVLQGVISVAVPYPEILKLIRSLSKFEGDEVRVQKVN
jgi:hypothetical protein